MSTKAIIGSVVHSISLGEIEVFDKAAILYNDSGVIEAIYDLSNHEKRGEFEARSVDETFDCGNKLIIPGFVDCHCHAPQYEFTGTGIDVPLLDWLKMFTFPCESKFSDVTHAQRVYEKTVRRHLKCGTTFASYFATIHNAGTRVLADVIEELGQRAFVGKLSMDQHAPEFYIEETETSIADMESFCRQLLARSPQGRQLLSKVDDERDKGTYDPSVPFEERAALLNNESTPRVMPCVTPRFVPTCSEKCLEGLGSISHRSYQLNILSCSY